MILISIFSMIFLTSLTGTLIFAFWKLASVMLERFGEIGMIYFLLRIVLIFYLVPVVFLWMVWWGGVLDEREAGGLLAVTPLLIKIAKVLSVIWLIGFLVEVGKYMVQRGTRKVERKISMPGGACSREVAQRVGERLHIKKKIFIYELQNCKSPFVEGIFKCRIFIPPEIKDEKELEMILEHELYHHRRSDLYMKKLCTWIVRLQWFNPVAHRLVSQVDVWGDSFCDLHMCYGCLSRWDIKEYFRVVIKYSEEKGNSNDSMYMGKDRKEIWRRMERMRNLKTQRRMKRVSALFLIVCFAMASAITSMAAGAGVENLYKKAYDASLVQVKKAYQEPELEEFTRERTDDMDIVETDEEVNLDAKVVNTYTWELKAGVIYETGIFWATKGDKIVVSIAPSPTNARTGVGLDQPDGILRGVTSTGGYSYTFTVNQTGIHRVYAENLENKTITVGVAVSR